ncbi:hypothetical protein LC065_13275 [Halobacillus litoralis]|uniref:hypothetical protein n=1 Tax=Halobacillus litoralis TaxID=45668 RepID=UPI00273F7558|nr:hypothetical protein [Halobacillus litoralis]WLR46539.1 hypothetical protein LC065_13275 [Halobacillus litoralis]
MTSSDHQNNQDRLINNSVMPECIRVEKVYDWVTDVNTYKNKTVIPDGSYCKESCREKVEEALKKHHNLRVECEAPDFYDPSQADEIEEDPHPPHSPPKGNHDYKDYHHPWPCKDP